jgi:hypothetical protein
MNTPLASKTIHQTLKHFLKLRILPLSNSCFRASLGVSCHFWRVGSWVVAELKVRFKSFIKVGSLGS